MKFNFHKLDSRVNKILKIILYYFIFFHINFVITILLYYNFFYIFLLFKYCFLIYLIIFRNDKF